jgi:small subunit ribosomal protein S18
MLAKKQQPSTIGLNKKINYKDTNLLKFFSTKQGKILPRRVTGLTVQQQRQLTKAIKRARILSLLPFVTSNLILTKNKDI